MRTRERLILPLAVVVTFMWVAAGVEALYRGDVGVITIISVPFGIITGYVYGINVRPGKGDDE